MNGYQELANAIATQAGWDYMEALKTLRQTPDSLDAAKTKTQIERFMCSDWFGVLTKADPDYLIKKMREAADK